MNSKNVIELNGKRYDALTGTLLGTAQITHNLNASGAKPTKGLGTVHTVDGILKPKQVLAATAAQPRTKVSAASPAQPITASKAKRTVAVHAAAHKPQGTNTLMRAAVSKPLAGFKQQATVQGTLQHAVPHIVAVKQSVASIDPSRQERAHATPRSQHVSRYEAAQAHRIDVSVQHVAVQEPPTKPVALAAPTPAPSNKPIDIFEHALQNASHFRELPNHAHFKKHARRHFATVSAGSLVLLFIAGFVAYQNVPGVQYRLAGMKSGISTGMPRLNAAGYVVEGVSSAQSGKVTVIFRNPTTAVQYHLTEQASNWTSSEMIVNVAAVDASGTPNYTTAAVGTTTVYRFTNDSATWVNNGTWYQLSGTSLINDQQVATIVKNS